MKPKAHPSPSLWLGGGKKPFPPLPPAAVPALKEENKLLRIPFSHYKLIGTLLRMHTLDARTEGTKAHGLFGSPTVWWKHEHRGGQKVCRFLVRRSPGTETQFRICLGAKSWRTQRKAAPCNLLTNIECTYVKRLQIYIYI